MASLGGYCYCYGCGWVNKPCSVSAMIPRSASSGPPTLVVIDLTDA
ncbi:hypothetical protein ACFXC8_35720 [Streptomyces sp. NPDC059441]